MGQRVSQGASAVVTGAGRGIGRAIALDLAKRGGRVVCADLRLERAEETALLIEARGGRAVAEACDVGDQAAVESLARKSEQWLDGPVDLVVNNAGIGVGGSNIGDVSMEDWRRTVDVNLWGVVHGCHVFAPRLRMLGRGGVLNVCSAASFAAAPTMGPYNLTKAAVLALTETLRAEMAGTSVNVTALCPTFVKTNIVRDGHIPGDALSFAHRLMDLTGTTPERVARVALDALDRDQLYALPQIEARLVWGAKRHAPVLYAAGTRWLARALGRGAERTDSRPATTG